MGREPIQGPFVLTENEREKRELERIGQPLELLEVFTPNVRILGTVNDESLVGEVGCKAVVVAFGGNAAGLD